MSKKYIADTLKRLREAVGLTTVQVGELIGKSGKTVSAWENGRGHPDAEILIQLCDIYKVNNLLAEFDESDNLKKESTISDTEISMINKYRSLDTYGKNVVDMVLTAEYDRVLVKMQERVETGEIGIFCVNDNGYIKKFGGNVLISLNKKYPEIPLNNESRCFGKVLGVTNIVSDI